MMGGCFPLVLFFVILIQCQFYAFPLPSTSSSQTNLSSILLQDVLTAITLSERWNLKDVRVSKLDLGKFRFSTSQNYDLRIGIGNQKLTLQTLEEYGFWRKFKKPKSDFPSVFHQLPSLALLHTLHLEGPLDLRVDALHQLSLSLPMNITYTGLKHVLVGEGIILEIRGAQEASFFHSSHLDLPMKRSSTTFSEWKSELWPFLQSTCMMTVIPINISGAASLAASYSARKPGLYIETTFISEDTILLLPERSDHGSDRMYTKTKMSSCPFDALSLRLRMMEKILRSLLEGHKVRQNQMFVSFEANAKVSIAVKFPMDVVRYHVITSSRMTLIDKWTKWSKPMRETVRFEIVARVESNRLKPLSIERLTPRWDIPILKPNGNMSFSTFMEVFSF